MVIQEFEYVLKDGRKALIRSPRDEDIQGMLDFLYISAGETEYITRYPEECNQYTPEDEKALFDRIKVLQGDQGSYELKGRYYTYLKNYLSFKRDLNQLVAPSAMGVEDDQLAILLNDISQTYIAREEMRASVKSGNPDA